MNVPSLEVLVSIETYVFLRFICHESQYHGSFNNTVEFIMSTDKNVHKHDIMIYKKK